METRKLGNSDLNITRVGFGAWAIGGGGWEFGWGKQEDEDSVAAIKRALEMGVNGKARGHIFSPNVRWYGTRSAK